MSELGVNVSVHVRSSTRITLGQGLEDPSCMWIDLCGAGVNVSLFLDERAAMRLDAVLCSMMDEMEVLRQHPVGCNCGQEGCPRLAVNQET